MVGSYNKAAAAVAVVSCCLLNQPVAADIAHVSGVVRPSAASWTKTPCGYPAQPSVPAGPVRPNYDIPENDMEPCGPSGCVLAPGALLSDCEATCNNTAACVAFVFADSGCSGKSGPICWLKSAVGKAYSAACRTSRVVARPAIPAVDIPSRWASDVSPWESTPLPLYPRPQMVRGDTTDRDTGDPTTWTNLNGLWEWQPAAAGEKPPFGRTLANSILVPFPVESCLSGVAPSSSAEFVRRMWYRLQFNVTDLEHFQGSQHAEGKGPPARLLLHFGAVDWQSTVFLNGVEIGNHTGGYDGFDFDITDGVQSSNELLLSVYDPTDEGAQPNGKQRISAIDSPGGDTYTPSSGIWQTVWLEQVPHTFIESLDINQASTSEVVVSANLAGTAGAIKPASYSQPIKFDVLASDETTIIASRTGTAGQNVTIPIPSAQLWSPEDPHLYSLRVTAGDDAVLSYFGLRTFVQGNDTHGVRRPLLNGNFTFLAGFLDQSYWPDGQYTAPSDDALAFDIEAVPTFGMNLIRLHQKVNPERWYYHADRLGVIVFQDMVQKYGGANASTVPLFVEDLKAMIRGRRNHPSIVQFTTFNEADCWAVFTEPPMDLFGIVELARELAPMHLVDTDSGGAANNFGIGDVNDIHSYPNPGDPKPSATQYAMIGEFGGIGAFIPGKEWKAGSCHTYLHVDTSADEASAYVGMAATILSRADHISASVYTQTTDVELECDGFFNYDRSNKFSAEDTASIRTANLALTRNQTL